MADLLSFPQDSATGANLDSMREHYGVSYDLISLVFLAIVAG